MGEDVQYSSFFFPLKYDPDYGVCYKLLYGGPLLGNHPFCETDAVT